MITFDELKKTGNAFNADDWNNLVGYIQNLEETVKTLQRNQKLLERQLSQVERKQSQPFFAVCTIQQQSNGRYLDAHTSKDRDYSVVTRTEQKNTTQRWIIKDINRKSVGPVGPTRPATGGGIGGGPIGPTGN